MADAAVQPIVDFLTRFAAALGIHTPVDVEHTPDGPRLNMSGEEAELLVRHRGEPLKALQHVVDMAFGREVGEQGRLVEVAAGRVRRCHRPLSAGTLDIHRSYSRLMISSTETADRSPGSPRMIRSCRMQRSRARTASIPESMGNACRACSALPTTACTILRWRAFISSMVSTSLASERVRAFAELGLPGGCDLQVGCGHFDLDNVRLDAIPEPSAAALVALALLAQLLRRLYFRMHQRARTPSRQPIFLPSR